ncbi:nuclear transport factor 2 family protein [Gordonia alkaliphila]|uniref:limonene-1,2-epoxide hydrolase family protein n=1 Tax=Gordonia alkaliphila TaxID=1053547 RepID=UPI001FF55CBE|nr:limonene-1,2-epoxide hydrolase family protein [Gordonia alkaliphila]MCK0439770.1 nuclear transport factor 2 family protein [Gordonia alkaliphila]
MTSQKPADLVTDFFANLASGRVEQALAVVDEQILYQNVGLPSVRGKAAFGRAMRALNGDRVGFDAEILAISADDDGVVLTERIDELRIGPVRMTFWVCGRNEVRDGVIVVWRDYFDFWNCARAFARGVAALAIPALRRPLRKPVSALPARTA